jgi:hypothetical protein
MSLSPSHQQVASSETDAPETESGSSFVELAIAIGFAGGVSMAMVVWLLMLALALWEGVRWLIS